ncbi:Hypothetical predicted protein, partial [Pelobates cultripes]
MPGYGYMRVTPSCRLHCWTGNVWLLYYTANHYGITVPRVSDYVQTEDDPLPCWPILHGMLVLVG